MSQLENSLFALATGIGVLLYEIMIINLEKETHQVELIYEGTSAFKIGFILSILSFLLLILYWLKTPVKARS